eukprot:m.16688 g.16688  ORF g.16688 m.16688 type:complete len:932 (-) comp3526_c0_seq1:72-2867(-)
MADASHPRVRTVAGESSAASPSSSTTTTTPAATRRTTDLDSVILASSPPKLFDTAHGGSRLALLESSPVAPDIAQLLAILRTPDRCAEFEAYLGEGMQQYVHFFTECEEHRKMRGPRFLSECAVKICNEFVIEDCPSPIKLSHSTTQQLRHHAVQADIIFFSRAQRETLSRLARFVSGFLAAIDETASMASTDTELTAPTSPTRRAASSSVIEQQRHNSSVSSNMSNSTRSRSKTKKFLKSISSTRKRKTHSTPSLANSRFAAGYDTEHHDSFQIPGANLMAQAVIWDFLQSDADLPADTGVHQYCQKSGKRDGDSTIAASRAHWATERGLAVTPSNVRPARLLTSFKEYLEIAESRRPLCCSWPEAHLLKIAYDDGTVVTSALKHHAPDLRSMVVDRTFAHKLEDKSIKGVTDAVFVEETLIFTTFTRPGIAVAAHFKVKGSEKRGDVQRIPTEKPIVFHDAVLGEIQQSRPAGYLAINHTHTLLVQWWPRPDPDFHSVGNIMLLLFEPSELRLTPYANLRPDPPIYFLWCSRVQENKFFVLFGDSSPSFGFDLQFAAYEVFIDKTVVAHSSSSKDTSSRISLVKSCLISCTAPVTAYGHSPDESKLVLIDAHGVLTLIHVDLPAAEISERMLSHESRVLRNAMQVAWHPDGGAFAVATRVGVLQFFDCGLNLLWCSLGGENPTPAPSLDLSLLGVRHSGISLVSWSAPVMRQRMRAMARLNPFESKDDGLYGSGSNCLAIVTDLGPVVILAFELGIFNNSLFPSSLIANYMAEGSSEAAVAVARELNWDKDAFRSLDALRLVLDKLFQSRFSPLTNQSIRDCFPLFAFDPQFHNPEKAIMQRIRSLMFRYLCWLLQSNQLVVALHLATELREADMLREIALAVKHRAGEESRLVGAAAQAALAVVSNRSNLSLSSADVGTLSSQHATTV